MFITHDMSVVKHISDDILVMYVGCMVEKSSSDDLFDHPMHPYTKGVAVSHTGTGYRCEKKRVLLQENCLHLSIKARVQVCTEMSLRGRRMPDTAAII